MKGTFNQGWWNCFENFAAELLDVNSYAENVCTNVLTAAGISEHEALSWLGRYRGNNMKVYNIVHEYWMKIRKKNDQTL